MQEPKSPSSMQDGQYTDYGTPHTDDEERSIQERAADVADKAQEKVSDYGSKLHEQADVNIDRAADGLEKAAEEMRSRMGDKGGVQSQVGTRVADSLDKTSQYLRDHQAEDIWNDMEHFVKEHPIQAAVTAAFAGFMVARMMK